MRILDFDDDDYIIHCNDFATTYGLVWKPGTVGRVESVGAACRLIRERMEREQFWPDVWFVNDHGNVALLALDSDTDDPEDYRVADEWV